MNSSRIPQDATFSTANVKKCEKYVVSMQTRLDEAVANNDYKSIQNIFNILVRRSRAVKILAIWRITYRNSGKNTAGTDGESIPKASRESTDYIRHRLLREKNIKKKPDAIRRVYIPKSNGKKRPLGIPTLKDRIIQEIIRIALEPIAEYHFHDNSFGFRPKRRCQDAMDMLQKCLSKADRKKYIVEGDIKSCFDFISHDHITKTLIGWHVPKYATHTIERMLKAKVFDRHKLHETTEGTPQGGVISPMLANIALTAFDDFIAKRFGSKSYHGGKHYISPMIRYADDFVILCRSKTQAKMVKTEITKFLSEKIGLTLSDEKTRITHIKKGFDFLGFNFRKTLRWGIRKPKGIKDYILLTTPTKESRKKILQNCKEVINGHKQVDQTVLIKLLNAKLIGWGLYYKYANSKRDFTRVDYELWYKLWKWCRRRHNRKNDSWIKSRYFDSNGYFKSKENALTKLSTMPIERYIKAKKGKRVYNKEDKDYWLKREKALMYRTLFYQRQFLYKRQKGVCPQCTTPFCLEDKLHIHHVKPKAFGGTDNKGNLQLLHAECHRDLHRHIVIRRNGKTQAIGI